MMKLADKINNYRQEIIKIVESNHTLYPRILKFDLDGYDLDETYLEIVVDRTSEFEPDDIGKLQDQLESLLGVSVYAFTPNRLPDDQRDDILAAAKPI